MARGTLRPLDKEGKLGRLWNRWDLRPLTPLVAVVGKNGVGRSDCLTVGAEEACDQRGTAGELTPVEVGAIISCRSSDRAGAAGLRRHSGRAPCMWYTVSVVGSR